MISIYIYGEREKKKERRKDGAVGVFNMRL